MSEILAHEAPPPDFECAICGRQCSNRWNYSPRNFERPPVCNACENISGFSWTGAPKQRVRPTGGTHHDRRNAIRIAALADAIGQEAAHQEWSNRHGRT